MKTIKTAVIGAGGRGSLYAGYALHYPHEMEITAVAEPNPARREAFRQRHGLAPQACHADWRDLLAGPRCADALLICTQDTMHYEPTIRALEAGYHVLLEKPMSTVPAECVDMGERAKRHDAVFAICHVLRYTVFFATLKRLLDEGRIGQLVTIQHNENVSYWHQAHSYVRGNWRNSAQSSPMIVAKCCHDMDALLWLAGADCELVSSFGSLAHFRPEHAPAGATARCLDGCAAADECAYYAPRHYLTANVGWPTSAISDDPSYEARLRALREGPYGRCVYACDNDVVDHQVASLQFANGVTAAFTMSAFTYDNDRTIKLMGTKGEIRGAMGKGELEIVEFATGHRQTIALRVPDNGQAGHGGGDFVLMADFLRQVRERVARQERGERGDGGGQGGRTSADKSVQGHLMAFAAERSRLENRVVRLEEFFE
ncbi:MAG: Gfo/Idh/MocA family oxidoreductase [Paenibacillaceae bacterium]|nr:Gfo/Idh/MocA family oxidoreductase [Paenibacillaceae bacterium]